MAGIVFVHKLYVVSKVFIFEARIRAELDRIQGGAKMPDRAWEQAKQPVRTCGLGLQDNTLED